MLCQKCGVREARCIATSCDGVHCYELHLCLECAEGRATFPTPEEQRAVVAPAMEAAREAGWDANAIADALKIDPEEIQRVLRGEGVSDTGVWETMKAHLRSD